VKGAVPLGLQRRGEVGQVFRKGLGRGDAVRGQQADGDQFLPRPHRQPRQEPSQCRVGLSAARLVVGDELLQVAPHLFTGGLALEGRESADGFQMVPKFNVPIGRLFRATLAVLVGSSTVREDSSRLVASRLGFPSGSPPGGEECPPSSNTPRRKPCSTRPPSPRTPSPPAPAT